MMSSSRSPAGYDVAHRSGEGSDIDSQSDFGEGATQPASSSARFAALGVAGSLLALACLGAICVQSGRPVLRARADPGAGLQQKTGFFNAFQAASSLKADTDASVPPVHSPFGDATHITSEYAEPGSPFGVAPFPSQEEQLKSDSSRLSHKNAIEMMEAMMKMKQLFNSGLDFHYTPMPPVTPLPTVAPEYSGLSQRYCNAGEELYDSKCYKTCKSLTSGEYPIRTTAYSCCKATPCDGVGKMGGPPFPCQGFDVNANGECPKKISVQSDALQAQPSQSGSVSTAALGHEGPPTMGDPRVPSALFTPNTPLAPEALATQGIPVASASIEAAAATTVPPNALLPTFPWMPSTGVEAQ